MSGWRKQYRSAVRKGFKGSYEDWHAQRIAAMKAGHRKARRKVTAETATAKDFPNAVQDSRTFSEPERMIEAAQAENAAFVEGADPIRVVEVLGMLSELSRADMQELKQRLAALRGLSL